MSDNEKLAADLATGLRQLADMVAAHPELAEEIRYSLDGINVALFGENARAVMADFVRAGKAHGATIAKKPSAGDKYFSAVLSWGAVSLDVFAERELVCERVVVGTETVTETVQDPVALAAVPTVERTVTRDIVEWECQPLLAPAVGGAR